MCAQAVAVPDQPDREEAETLVVTAVTRYVMRPEELGLSAVCGDTDRRRRRRICQADRRHAQVLL